MELQRCRAVCVVEDRCLELHETEEVEKNVEKDVMECF